MTLAFTFSKSVLCTDVADFVESMQALSSTMIDKEYIFANSPSKVIQSMREYAEVAEHESKKFSASPWDKVSLKNPPFPHLTLEKNIFWP